MADQTTPVARNLKRIGRLDIPGGGQVVVDGDYAYVGHMAPPHGTTIIDISDPSNPKVVSTIDLKDGYSHTHKARVVGDLLYTNFEQYDRHTLRRGDTLGDDHERLAGELGHDPSDAELSADIGFDVDTIAKWTPPGNGVMPTVGFASSIFPTRPNRN